jgi:hypothetical protein
VAVVLVLSLVRRSFAVSRRAAWALALAPLLFTGKAMLTGGIYGPSDLYYLNDPWKRVVAEQSVAGVPNGILSDLAFANLPWRAAVREAVVNGRVPLWNRFVLTGNPLLGSGSAAVFHPSTWLGLWLPVAQSWTFSCTLTIFLSLLSAYLFFLDWGLGELPCLLGAVIWAFSTYMLFWNGWSVGTSTATFPLLLAGLRRIARRSPGGWGITLVACLLTLAGGHPESLLHGVSAGGLFFLWELSRQARESRPAALRRALHGGIAALLLSGPFLLPLLEAIPHSAEYRTRQAALSSGGASQSVSAAEAARRLLPDVLPFAYGIFGKSPMQSWRDDGSGMPLGYCGALAFPLAYLGLFPRHRTRSGRFLFLTFLVVGLLAGASAPGLLDLLDHLPGFRIALNYRLVFLAAFGLAGLAALGAEEVEGSGSRRLVAISLATACALVLIFVASRGILGERELPTDFVRGSFLAELAPVVLLAVSAFAWRGAPRRLLGAALVLLAAERVAEMGETYPTLPARTLAPSLPSLSALSLTGRPYRVVATGETLRPNGATLYGLEDVRGYESIMLDRFADTFALWCRPQPASFNRVDDLERPFLGFLGARYAILSPDGSAPGGWRLRKSGPEMRIAENLNALPRAFVPRSLRYEEEPARTLSEMSAASDFSETAWVRSAAASARGPNGSASLEIREAGPDLVVTALAQGRVFVATSVPDWPGWSVRPESGGAALPTVTVNHAFVGFWLPQGRTTVRMSYCPDSFRYGLCAGGLGLILCLFAARKAGRAKPSAE